MPQRENEIHLNEESNLRYCVICQEYFQREEWHGGHPRHGKPYRRGRNVQKDELTPQDVHRLMDTFNIPRKTPLYTPTNETPAPEQEELDEPSTKRTTSWFGNQYYDSKKKKWRNGKYRWVSIGPSNRWARALLLSVLVILMMALLLNYLYHGARFFILGQ